MKPNSKSVEEIAKKITSEWLGSDVGWVEEQIVLALTAERLSREEVEETLSRAHKVFVADCDGLGKTIEELDRKLVGLDITLYKNVEELQKAWEALDDERKAKIASLEKQLGEARATIGHERRRADNLHGRYIGELEAQVKVCREGLERIVAVTDCPSLTHCVCACSYEGIAKKVLAQLNREKGEQP